MDKVLVEFYSKTNKDESSFNTNANTLIGRRVCTVYTNNKVKTVSKDDNEYTKYSIDLKILSLAIKEVSERDFILVHGEEFEIVSIVPRDRLFSKVTATKLVRS